LVVVVIRHAFIRGIGRRTPFSLAYTDQRMNVQ